MKRAIIAIALLGLTGCDMGTLTHTEQHTMTVVNEDRPSVLLLDKSTGTERWFRVASTKTCSYWRWNPHVGSSFPMMVDTYRYKDGKTKQFYDESGLRQRFCNRW